MVEIYPHFYKKSDILWRSLRVWKFLDPPFKITKSMLIWKVNCYLFFPVVVVILFLMTKKLDGKKTNNPWIVLTRWCISFPSNFSVDIQIKWEKM